MATIMTASKQWATRPVDQRYTSLVDMHNHFERQRQISKGAVISNRKLKFEPTGDNGGIEVFGGAGVGYTPTHWAFGQIANQYGAPASYLRKLHPALVADQLNYLSMRDEVQDVGILVSNDGNERTFKAMTGPRYGRIWNEEVTRALVNTVGDGVNGDWRVPGIFGQRVEVDQQNTTMYASDRDMFVFLADEEHRIELPNRRNGQPGTLARGFFVWNSEVGSQTFGIAAFLFDYVCANRIVWGAEEYQEVKIKHTAGAPDRFFEEIQPALTKYANSGTGSVLTAIEDARADRLDDVGEFLLKRFGKRAMDELQDIHMAEEDRPIETRWDVITAVTAKARDIPYQDQRVELERQAGELMAA